MARFDAPTPPAGEWGLQQIGWLKVAREKPAHILKYFAYRHLPAALQEVSAPFYAMADELDSKLPDCAEKSSGLRKLLEAKDCMVRAALEPVK